ncbi:VOC family protein [Pseudonocardia pini]|uniref:VOC family protein n=1 Tax=Pseudonocardia pini TaxID=2758030 RepID=UPI0028ADD6A3|nr:VOC family protein [Pseudonocardia pini]
MAHRVHSLFHPSLRVPDLAEAMDFFTRVFGRRSTVMEDLISPEVRALNPAYPRDYCAFTLIQDVYFDTIDPQRYVIDGVQRYPTVTEPHLKSLAFYVEDPGAAFTALREHGIRVVDQRNRIADGDDPPQASSRPMILFWTLAEDAGLSYEIFPADVPYPGDARRDAGWVLPEVSPDDPLGIQRCSHHTVLTDQVGRALRIAVDVLGGTVIGEGWNDLLGTHSTYVHVAGSTLEYAQPMATDGVEAHVPVLADHRRTAPDDCYHSITWQVRDLDVAARHLEAQKVGVRARTSSSLVTDPATSLGVPWCFTSELVAGDPRE